ncbi:MAG: DUF1285 domain-containing protein [Motiliproteus sp.]
MDNKPTAPKSFDSSALAAQVKRSGADGLPPVNSWSPEISGDIDLVVDRQGQWHHEGVLFEREALAKLFASILRKDGDEYFVLTPVEKWRIQVEDVPFLITEMELKEPGPQQRIELLTSLGDRFYVDAEHPLWLTTDQLSGEPSPYVRVRDRLDGLLSRSVFYRLAELLQSQQVDGHERLGVLSCGQFFVLDDAPEPAA